VPKYSDRSTGDSPRPVVSPHSATTVDEAVSGLTDCLTGHGAGPSPCSWRAITPVEVPDGLEFEWISRADHEATVKRLEEKIAVLAMQKDYWWHKSLGQAG
jgi:hypothetical protein